MKRGICMKLTNQEKEDLQLSIQGENVMLGRVRSMMMTSLMIAATAIILALTVLKTYPGWQITAYVVTGIFGVLALMSFLSWRNGKKHLLQQIYKLEDNK